MTLPQPQPLTLREVQKTLGSEGHKWVKTRTLSTWVARGLLPQHDSVKGLGRGRGVRVLYPASILDRARKVAELMNQGIPENTIREQLAAREREFAVGLVHKYADFHRILSPESHRVWFSWFENQVDKIKDWKLADQDKDRRARFNAANHLSEFRLILDTIEYRLLERGQLRTETKQALDEMKVDVEKTLGDLDPSLVDQFRVS